ncbi:carbohydrate deacetylase [Oceanobacillus kimchii]|uniref:carbohydrate deacetylase n=1 Tax=Oceanobacillus kimchii TaxID=746691 RepID=UPI0021A4C539|nr:carbohydrate deacetylase [Oceanobacillus kimchii]MCT1578950.1 carbohydrate deacetylase [Oceanobacillus kimchii]MCT2137875.1 carbohydrate deacetylase [Oceanobacillus kimchii]
MSRRKLIVNADDFGLSPGVTMGILYAHQFGIVSSTTTMVNTVFAKDSIQLARNFPDLGVGLHVVLDRGKPISLTVPSLIDRKGNFLKGEELLESAEKKDVKEEIICQLERLLSWYPKVTHLDSHHHVHTHISTVAEAIEEVAKEYRLPIRTLDGFTIGDILTPSKFIGGFYGEGEVSATSLINLLNNIKEDEVTELMCHPGFLDNWLMDQSSYQQLRVQELETLINQEVKNSIFSNDIECTHYGCFL